jgi:glycosyltransferase involved in cell wall biosynthesis
VTTQLPLRTLIVIPAWNEAESIAGVLDEIASFLPDVDTIVVDDGSSDGTSDVVRSRGVPVLVLPFNLGVGAAMRTGFKYALQHGYAAMVQVDADGQHDPADLPRLIDALVSGADIAIGARFAGVGDYTVRGPRWLAMRLLARSLSRRTGVQLTDATSGFRASSQRAIRLFAAHYPAEYFGDTLESLVMAARSGLSVAQVPVAMRARVAGTPSHAPWKAMVYLLRAQLALILATMRRWPEVAVEQAEQRKGVPL